MAKDNNAQPYFDTLKRIAAYLPPDKLRDEAEKEYGLPFEEALEYAYENVIGEARAAIKGKRRPPMPNPTPEIAAKVKELREAEAAAVRTDKTALAQGATWGDQADAQKASDLYHALCFRHMPAILEALERMTGERDAAMEVVQAYRCHIEADHSVGADTPKVMDHLRDLQRAHPHLFKTESEDAK